jgi:hypothetical protein
MGTGVLKGPSVGAVHSCGGCSSRSTPATVLCVEVAGVSTTAGCEETERNDSAREGVSTGSVFTTGVVLAIGADMADDILFGRGLDSTAKQQGW